MALDTSTSIIGALTAITSTGSFAVHRHRRMTHRMPTASQGIGRCSRFVNPLRVGIMGSRSERGWIFVAPPGTGI
jgi:hypothetical protein